MDRDRMEGKGKEFGGTLKDKAGEFTGDEKMEAEGEADRTEGKAQGALGKVKDAARDIADTAKDAVKR